MLGFGKILIGVSNTFFACLNRTVAWLGGTVVPKITTAELRRLQTEQGHTFVLVDVRSDAESAVSLIPGAISMSQYESHEAQYRGRLVIAYCTIGGRSYLYARKLAKQGIRSANYKASILGWCDAGLSLVAPDGQATNRVHVYSHVFNVPDDYDSVC